MWKTSSLVVFHVCVGVIHHGLPKARLVFTARAFQAELCRCFQNVERYGQLKQRALPGVGHSMAEGPIPMSAWRLVLSDTLVRGNQSKAEDFSSSHQSPACSQRASQSAQASGQRIHQRGQRLTSRKMSSTLHTSGQIGAQCH